MFLAAVAAVCILAVTTPERNAHAATTVYNVARGVETPMVSWLGGVNSRGINNVKMQIGTVTFDSSYPTGGETLDLSGTFDNAVLFCVIAPQDGLTFEYVHATASAPATGVVKAFTTADTEVTNGTDLYQVATEFFAIGW